MKNRLLSVLLIILFLTNFSCTQEKTTSKQLVHKGLRIISLAPNLTEILFKLGVGNQIIGVTLHCTYPPEAKKKEIIGDFIHPNLEKIVQLKPDLIVAEKWPSSKTVYRLRQFGLRVVDPASPRSLEEIYAIIQTMGQIVKKTKEANRLITNMKKRIKIVREKGNKITRRPSVYVEISLPSWTVGKQSFVNEALNICGADNLFSDIQKRALLASKETIIARNPDIILSFAANSKTISERPGWTSIHAVRNGNIIDDFDQDILSHGNHRLVEAIEQLQVRFINMLDG